MPTMASGQRTTMQAITYNRYGPPDVLELRDDLGMPAIGHDEVLVRVHAAGVDPGVWLYLTGEPRVVRTAAGLLKPKRQIPGRALAGRVEAVGRDVTDLEPGDEVYGQLLGGAYAQYAAAPAEVLALKPANLTFEQAAAVPLSAATALQGLRDVGKVRPGDKVLINGASGGVGTFAVQIAKALGAEVTGVCGTRNVDLVRSLGADQVIDYTREDFTAGGPRYDLILDLVGNHSVPGCRRALTPKGTLVLSSGPPNPVIRRILTALVLSPLVSQRLVSFTQKVSRKDLDDLRALIEAGRVTPVMDRTFPLREAAEALRHQGAGHARGKTVLTI
jgi:NADPH:quinone reductase-like Zn-dependent oxidoreductase